MILLKRCKPIPYCRESWDFDNEPYERYTMSVGNKVLVVLPTPLSSF